MAFEGRLQLDWVRTATRVVVLRDDFDIARDARLQSETMPAFDFEFVQQDGELIPRLRGPIRAEHPLWEFVLEPGPVWLEQGTGAVRRAVLPFSLAERNANCTHNGVLALRFEPGARSRAVWQISSQTCAYFQFEATGSGEVTLLPGPVADAAQLRAGRRAELERRWPTQPISSLRARYPGVEPGGFLHPEDVDPASVTTYGLVVDGMHYVGECATRRGPHPDCDAVTLPSYSLAKSLFAGLASMRLEHDYAGSMRTPIAGLVPACSAERWGGVTIADALDMATGLFESDTDEDAAIESDLFVAEDHATRIRYACTRYARQAAPGTQFVYHTSDTYIAGTAMAAVLASKQGFARDLYRDLIVHDLWTPLGLSPVAFETRRTRDAVAQPFVGCGLFFHAR